MAAPRDRTDHQLDLLATLVTQRRASLRMSVEEAASFCGLAHMTYRKVEGDRHNQGVAPVRDTTYAKIETAFEFTPGSCRAVLDGATSIRLLDGTDLVPGAQITHPSLDQVATEVKQAMGAVAGLHAPELTHGQTDEMAAGLVKELQRRGILPPGD
ncbi:hypothetical protein ACIPJG_33750 [Streptomyces halstedii]|uniref:hypothetical protein n=1 Tax=Streptomyces halstedii TaxID=1944 RepID=UPI003804B882